LHCTHSRIILYLSEAATPRYWVRRSKNEQKKRD
jgi:hypothetical protein